MSENCRCKSMRVPVITTLQDVKMYPTWLSLCITDSSNRGVQVQSSNALWFYLSNASSQISCQGVSCHLVEYLHCVAWTEINPKFILKTYHSLRRLSHLKFMNYIEGQESLNKLDDGRMSKSQFKSTVIHLNWPKFSSGARKGCQDFEM